MGEASLAVGRLLSSSTTPGGVPPKLRTSFGPPSYSENTRIAGHPARAYRWAKNGRSLVAYVLPTPNGDAAIMCSAPTGSSVGLDACIRIAEHAQVSGPTVELGTLESPNNDDYLHPFNLNLPPEPLSTNALERLGDTIGATEQANLLSPCNTPICRTGPAETLTCGGVSYGKTVWYDFYPDHNGQIEIRTFGFPNVIALYTYSSDAIPHWQSCAPGSTAKSNELFAIVQRGVNYTFQVGGRDRVGGSFQMLFNYAYSTKLAVAPFLTRPSFAPLGAPGTAAKLRKLLFVGLTRQEQVSFACSACGSGPIGKHTIAGNTLTDVPNSAPPLTSATRLIVSATAPAQIGRFQIYEPVIVPNATNDTFRVIHHGCLAPGAPPVTAAAARDPASLDQVKCPSPPVNLTGAEYAFWDGDGSRLQEEWYTGARWIGPLVIPGASISNQPAVAAHPNGEQDVFWKGADGNLWEMWYTSRWYGPSKPGGTEQLGSNPTAGIDSANDEYVFWRNRYYGLSEMTYTPEEQWTGPVQVYPGPIGSAPAVAVHGDGQQDVFWRGVNGHLYEMTLTGQGGKPRDLGGGQLGSSPSVGIDGAGVDHVFWEGTDGKLSEMTNADGHWGRPITLASAPIGSRPEVAVHPDGELDVFWRGPDHRLWEMWYTGRWNGPSKIGTGILDTSPGVATAAVGKVGGGT
jgi:hypothetical protein